MKQGSSVADIFAKSLFIALLAGSSIASAALSVTLSADQPSGQPVGTPIKLNAAVTGANGLPVAYQFSWKLSGEIDWHLMADYNIWPAAAWTNLREGAYQLRVIATTWQNGDFAQAIVPFQLTPRTNGLLPTVSATAHELVALYSAPPCVAGSMQVRFKPLLGGTWQKTLPKQCQPGEDLSFYVAGMREETTYLMQHQGVYNGQLRQGPMLTFTTGSLVAPLEDFSVTNPRDFATSSEDGILLSNYVINDIEKNYPVAVDLDGNVVWHYSRLGSIGQSGAFIARPVLGGTMLVIMRQFYDGQILKEIDLAGNVVMETNANAISAQLTRLGHDRIGSIHHEANRLPNGHTAVLGSVERTLTDVQGSGDVNVYGEMVVVLDENFQVDWAWNAFDHLDPAEMAILRETCISEGPGCPPLFNGEDANDWLHGNSVAYSPLDGNLIVSFRHLDMVVKIAYENGAGDGHVVWKFGRDRDFTLLSGDDWPWFSHQHDARYNENGLLVLFDNGNTRVSETGSGNSRGQAYLLNENTMTAILVHNFDLGGYSAALGSAELLSNGNYHFLSGFEGGPPNLTSRSIEVTPLGIMNWVHQSNGGIYRSFRLGDMYRP